MPIHPEINSNHTAASDNILLVNRALIFDDENVLLLRRSDTDSYNSGLWEFPGGKVDDGEETIESLKREVYEETGLDILPVPQSMYTEQQPVVSRKHMGKVYVVHFYIAKLLGGEVRVSDEHAEYAWESLRYDQRTDLTAESRRALMAFRLL